MCSSSPRERILSAFNHQNTDMIPFDIGGIKTTSMNVTAHHNLERYLGMASGAVQWGNYLSQRVHMPAAMSEFLGGDVRRVHVPHPSPLPSARTAPVQLDEWGVEWTKEPAGPFYVTRPPLVRAESRHDLAKFPWPEPATIFQSPEAIAEAALRARQSTDCAICLDLPDTVVHVSQNMRGYQEWLVDSAADVPFFESLLDRIAESTVQWLAQF